MPFLSNFARFIYRLILHTRTHSYLATKACFVKFLKFARSKTKFENQVEGYFYTYPQNRSKKSHYSPESVTSSNTMAQSQVQLNLRLSNLYLEPV